MQIFGIQEGDQFELIYWFQDIEQRMVNYELNYFNNPSQIIVNSELIHNMP